MMALTATATQTLRNEVCRVLGMQDVIVVELPPDKPNACKTFTSLMETFCPIVEKLKVEQVHTGRIIVFCKQRDLCNQIYSLFVYLLLLILLT